MSSKPRKSFYIQGSYWYEGSKIRTNFEGKILDGILCDCDEDKNLVCIIISDGTKHWTHESHCSLWLR